MKKILIYFILVVSIFLSIKVISQINKSKFTIIEQKINPHINKKTIEISNQDNLTATWYWESNNANNNMELYLHQNGDSVTGKHCSSFYNGSKLDCVDEEDENSITLNMISSNVFEGTLKSGFSNVIIPIRITFNPSTETILFQQLSQPEEEYYLPNDVTMTLAQD